MRELGLVVLVMGAELIGGCGHRHVSLENPGTSVGARYVCPPGAGACQAAREDVPSDRNPSGMTFFALPRQCAGHIHKIVILEADTSNPTVDVTCAPVEEPVGDTGTAAAPALGAGTAPVGAPASTTPTVPAGAESIPEMQ